MSTVLARVRVGSLSPERYPLILTHDEVEWLDLSGANLVSVELQVQKPSGALQTWACTIVSGGRATERQAYHAYLVGDLDEEGDYQITPKAVVVADITTGPVQFNRRTLRVFGRFE